jgi:hypothetical protein
VKIRIDLQKKLFLSKLEKKNYHEKRVLNKVEQ